ncbi:MAG TPA: hypothetical protein VFI08_13600 [Spirochaetia bacterium]|nr:hypothetical protein [Spirochaetia bacterium]
MEKGVPTTGEMRKHLAQMLEDANSLVVSRWLNDPKEKMDEIGETVGLMLQVVAALMGEIDVFIGSVDTVGAEKPEQEQAPQEVETELVDLVTDEPVSSLLDIEAPFRLAQSSP